MAYFLSSISHILMLQPVVGQVAQLSLKIYFKPIHIVYYFINVSYNFIRTSVHYFGNNSLALVYLYIYSYLISNLINCFI